MANKKEKTAKPPKKEKPTPVPCICERLPVVAKGKSGCSWVLACPASVTCRHAPMTRLHPSKDLAVEEWNTLINSIRYKEVYKA